MRDVTGSIQEAWDRAEMIGRLRPVVRVTVQHPKMKLRNFPLTSTFAYKTPATDISTATEADFIDYTKQMKVNQCYADFQFTNTAVVRELPNIKSVSWTRSIDNEVADCTVEIFNTGRPPGAGGTSFADELASPGYFTPNRGGSSFSSRWKHKPNEWFGMLMPDNILRTYEGYGTVGGIDDAESVPPEVDPNLVQTGVWIIDSVNITDSGGLSIKCRDIGRILMDQMFWMPVVPKDFYNYDWTNWGKAPAKTVADAAKKLKVKASDSSNTPWIGNSLTHNVAGHKLQHAFDGDPSTYWLSVGNVRPSRRFAYEWVQCSVGKQTVNQVRFRGKKKGYTAYVSVKAGGVWLGVKSINYHEDDIGRQNDGDIKYLKSVPVPDEKWVTVTFKAVAKVEAIRVTFGNLQDFHIGTYHYRAGIRDVEVYSPGTSHVETTKIKKGPAGSNPGKYEDYTDIIKLICAWGGFFWPSNGRQRDAGNVFHVVAPGTSDPVLGSGVKGRVWGDFQQTGTNGPAPLSFSNFDKKSLLDAITYIRDILGFIFFIDESGGIQWRLPNIFDRGNWRSTLSSRPGRTDETVTIDEERNLVSLSTSLDAANVREAYFVGVANANLDDGGTKIGAFAPGYNPNPTGLRRLAGWTDQNFESQAECEVMADMLSLRQLMTYRTDRVRIPGFPKIQVDDQVRIFERTTAEGHLHYVRSIASSIDMVSGEYFYDLETHWLGEDPKAQWLFKPEQRYRSTNAYLQASSEDNPFDGPSRKGNP